MKRKSLLFLLLFALLAPWAANAQSVTIGSGTSTSSYLPSYSYYNYSISQQIYTAEEISASGNITSVAFYNGGTAKDRQFDIYMAHTTKTAFESTSDWIALTDADIVYHGTAAVTMTAGAWTTFTLSAPFAYNGTDNLVICVIDRTGDYESGMTCRVFSTTEYQALYCYNDNYDALSPDGTNDGTAVSSTLGRPLLKNQIVLGGIQQAYPTPTDLTVSGLTATSATLNWTENGTATSWEVAYKAANDEEFTTVTTSTKPYTIEGLTPQTAYTAKVRAYYSETAQSGWVETSFTTNELCPDGKICIGEGTATSTYLPANNYYNYSLTQQIYTAAEIGEAGAILSIDFFKASTTAMAVDLDIYMVSTTKDEFASATDFVPVTSSDLVYSGTVTFADNAWTTIELDAPFIYDGTSNVAIMVDNNTGDYVSSTPFYVFSSDKNQALYAYADGTNYDPFAPAFSYRTATKNRIRLAIGEPPACPKPTGIAIDYQGGTEATIRWTSDAEAWNMRVNGTEINGTITNPYTLTGLELSTTYEVEVQANCGDATSEWAGPVSFTTDDCMPEDQIIVNYALTDSYGDGWNDNYILVVDESCNIVEMLTIESGNSASGTLRVCGSYMQFLWYAGNYPGETSWVFTDNAGNVLFEGAGTADMATLDVLYTIDNNPYSAPVDVAASEVGPRSAKLSWTETGTATAWQIKLTEGDDEEGTIINANSNPFVITGLTPETEYFAQVRATGANGTSIWTCLGADFTTTVACPKPSNLSAVPYPNSADLTWNGFADAYDLEWALLPASESKDALWLQYDDGTVVTNVGNSTIYEWTWAVMYPADMLQGNNMLSKVAFYETSYYSAGDPITINIYSGGDSEPGTLVYTENVTCTGTVGIHEVILSSSVNIDPAQNLWITLTSTTIDRPMAMSAVDEANGRWVDNGSWMDIGTALASVSTYTFMIRGYVEPGFDPSTLEWNPVSGITSPYTLEDLQPEKTYVVRVKAICGGEDGESEWAMITFKTPSVCDMPIDLAANDITYNSAKLSWTGYQESYNVRYRSLAKLESVTLTENFDEGMGDWTTIDADGDGYTWVSSMNPGDYHNAGVDLTGNGHNGSAQFVISGSYSNSLGEALTPDNYLVSPQIELGGGMEFWVSAQDAGYFAEHFGVAVSTSGNTDAADFTTIAEWTLEDGQVWHKYVVDLSAYTGQGYVAIRHFNCTDMFILNLDDISFGSIVPTSEWETVTVNEPTYTLTGLTPETDYEWQIQGVNASCGTLDWTEIQSFTTLEKTTETQVVELASGTNWFSTYVDITLEELQSAIQDALGTSVNATLKSRDANIRYTRGRWGNTPSNFVWDVALMYKIEVAAACEFTLEGMPLDPAEHTITLAGNGTYNWIGFPFAQSMSLTDAFAGFAVNGDAIKGKVGNNKYSRGRWSNSGLTTLEPGQGYMYQLGEGETRDLVYPNPGKSVKSDESPMAPQAPNSVKRIESKTLDLQVPRVPGKSTEGSLTERFKNLNNK